ncbi:hypothetical protein IKB17_01420 [bacterium]|nr:hypothetical protein [bacterium]
MLKRLLCLSILIIGTSSALAYNYDTNLPLPGKSIADENLQKNTLFTAYMFAHRIATPDCKDFAIVDSYVSEEKVDNKWQETWSIKACSKTALVPINFELNEKGAIYAVDPMKVKILSNE